MSFAPGTVIAGKYRVESVIGQGGMGIVLAARHLGLDEMVAVKLIREERAAGAEALARFQREARAAARIKSEHVARVLDVDRLPEGQPYIVMELIDGTDLHALLGSQGPLRPEEAATYLLQACEGLAEAHALGMVHRDLKLKNLFLTKRRDGRPLIKVIDFGVVKLALANDDDTTLQTTSLGSAAAAREHTLTGSAMLVGSVHYMAPEQIRASNVVDARADVWSLGVCLYSLLTNALPFDGDNIVAICSAIQGRAAPDVRALAPHVPAGIAETVARALEKDVRRRFASVGELARSLQPFGADGEAASRVEAILRSAAPARPREDAALVHLPAAARGEAPARGRVDSTIDAAAVGLRMPSSPAPRSGRRSLARTLGVVVGAAAVTVMVGLRFRSPGPTVEQAIPAAAPDPLPIPAAPVPSTHAEALPAASAAPVAPPSSHPPAKRPPARPSKASPAPARPAPSATTAQPPPKTDPTSAYDHF